MTFHTNLVNHVTHVTMRVTNIDRSRKYYEQVLGLTPLHIEEKKVDYTTDGFHNILSIIEPTGVTAKENNATGLYHFALLLPSRSDLANFTNHLIKLNERIGASDHLVSEALYLRDPDGNEIEIYADKDFTSWNWRETEVEMASLPLDFESLLETVTNRQFVKLPKKTIMGHIHLYANNLERMRKFYVDTLGLSIVSKFGDQALFLANDNYHHHIGINTWKGLDAPIPSIHSAGMEDFTYVVSNDEQLALLISKLNSNGYIVNVENTTIFVLDPENNKIILKVVEE